MGPFILGVQLDYSSDHAVTHNHNSITCIALIEIKLFNSEIPTLLGHIPPPPPPPYASQQKGPGDKN